MKIEILKATLLNTNNYLITHKNTTLLIEASVSLEELKKHTLNLDAIFLTHLHWDHYIHLQEIIEFYHCPVYFRKEGYDKLKNSNQATFYLDKKFNCTIENNAIRFLEESPVTIKEITITPCFTNGHTNCGCCYKIENYLFSGDTMFKGTYGRCDLPTSSLSDMINSIKKLLTLPEETIVYPGHGLQTTLKEEKETYSNLI